MSAKPARGRSVKAVTPPVVERRAISLSPEAALAADRAILELRVKKRRVSFSALIEAALLELLARPDWSAALERRGASARRRFD